MVKLFLVHPLLFYFSQLQSPFPRTEGSRDQLLSQQETSVTPPQAVVQSRPWPTAWQFWLAVGVTPVNPSLLSCCRWAAQVFQMITATSLSTATEATFVPAPTFSPFPAWPLFSSLPDLGHLHGYSFYQQHLVPDLPTSGCFPKLLCSNGDTKSARSSSSYCNYQGRGGVGRVGGKEIESWVVSAFSTPVPLLATLQALSPHQEQKVYRLLCGSCWRGLDTRNLGRWYVFVCAGDGLPGLAYARSTLYY